MAAVFFLLTILAVTIKKLFKPRSRIKAHHLLIIAGAAFVLPHIVLAFSVYLWYLPFFGWFGVAAALFFIAAILVVMVKSLVKPRLRMKLHRILALVGAAFAIVHIYFALSVYISVTGPFEEPVEPVEEAEVTAVNQFYLSRSAGKIVFEFSYPLKFPGGEGYNVEKITPGET